MKKIVLITIAFAAAYALTACDNEGDTHTHTWGAWQHNAAQHWQECTANDGAKTTPANHTGNPCADCGYTSGAQNPDPCECDGKAEDCECEDCDCETCEEHTHQWGEWILTIPPTIIEEGEETKTCASDPSHIETRHIDIVTFDSVAALKTYLLALPINTAPNSYKVALNTDNLWGITPFPVNKYISLDLSGSTFTALGLLGFGDGEGTLANYTWLTSITIPESVTLIEEFAFQYCSSLESITIPNSVTFIASQAFRNCNILKSVTVGNGVTSIGISPFLGCDSLTTIDVADDNTAYSSEDGILYNKDKSVLLEYPRGKTGTVNIPDSVKSIGDQAFSSFNSLINITIPDSVTSIGSGAFSNCYNLINITIPASVTSIGSGAFNRCTSLTSITVDANNPNYASQDGILYNKAKTSFIRIPRAISGSVTIPAGVTTIGGSAFEGCTSLTSITIPASVTIIDSYAFDGCTGLTSITIPSSVTYIGGLAFYNWTSSQTIYIEGHTNQEAADTAWNERWRNGCNATIKYAGEF